MAKRSKLSTPRLIALERQISPEYTKVMDGLEEVDPNSAEGKQFATVINTLMKQCK